MSDVGPGGRPYSADDIAAVAFFLRFAEVGRAIFGGRNAGEAFDAFARIIGVPAEDFRKVIYDDRGGD